MGNNPRLITVDLKKEVIKGGLVCRLIYVEKRLYIHNAGGKKVDISHRMTT